MNLLNVRWPAVLAAAAVTLALLLGINTLITRRTVEQPLQALYNSSPALESYQIERQGDTYEVRLCLKETPDLAAVYTELDHKTREILKKKDYVLEIKDHRNQQLEQSYRRMNLYVEEAMATGQFAEMADRIAQEADSTGLTARFAADSDRVYLQIHGEGGYLYSVVERERVRTPAPAKGGVSL